MMATVIRIEFICDNLLRSCRRAEQLGQSNQVVGGHCQRELEPHTRNATEHGPGETPNGLSPAERLFNPLTLLAQIASWFAVVQAVPVAGTFSAQAGLDLNQIQLRSAR